MRSTPPSSRLVAFTAAVALAAASSTQATEAAPASRRTNAGERDGTACARQETVKDAADVAARAALATAPARRKIGRMRGVRFISRVTFDAAPDEPHELALSLAFPARSRLTLESAGGRRERYQLGDTWFGQEAVSGSRAAHRQSYLLTGKDRDESRLDLALRRALFLWPDGAIFTGEGTTLTSKLDGLGALLAIVDGSTGRPQSIRAIGRKGRVTAELREVTWTVDGERAWPKSFVFAAAGKPLWSEVVERVEDEWLFADTWFLPSDRVAGMVGSPIEAALRMRVVEEAWAASSALPAETTLESALDLALERWSTVRDRLREQDLLIGTAVSVELDERRVPVAIEVETPSSARTDSVLKDVEAWSKRSRRAAWMYLCKAPEEATTSAFEAVADAVAEGAVADGPVVLRFDVEVDDGAEPGAPRVSRLRIVQAFRVSDPKGERESGGR